MTRIYGIAPDEPLDMMVRFHNFNWDDDDINNISEGIIDGIVMHNNLWVIPAKSNTLESVILAIMNDFDAQYLTVSAKYHNGKSYWVIDYDYDFIGLE